MTDSPVLRLLSLCIILSLACYAQESKTPPDFNNWDVQLQYGPADTVSFMVTEGTWMNLDVSPDGKEIVFDLLGDIYTLPVDGGQAQLLLGGLAFDVQPRYSPDGKWISFTSDRDGGDNIWICDRKGENLHQVTKEKFRLLNNAVWTPDGEYLSCPQTLYQQTFTGSR